MKKIILFAVLCFAVQGCVGLVIPKTRTKVINDPEVCVYRGAFDDVRMRDLSGSPDNSYKTNCTQEWLRASWGEPDHIGRTKANPDEVWTYKSSLVWEGIVPFVIVPIPLILPVTREKDRFTLRDGHVTSASVTKSVTVGGTYGGIPNPEGGGSWGVWNWDEDSK